MLRPRACALASAQIKLGMGGSAREQGRAAGAVPGRRHEHRASPTATWPRASAGRGSASNDAAAVVEATTALDPLVNQIAGAGGSDLCVGGGDGSMFLDHEVCVLAGDLNYRIDSTPRAVRRGGRSRPRTAGAAARVRPAAGRAQAQPGLPAAGARGEGHRLRADVQVRRWGATCTTRARSGARRRGATACCTSGVGCAHGEVQAVWEVRTSRPQARERRLQDQGQDSEGREEGAELLHAGTGEAVWGGGWTGLGGTCSECSFSEWAGGEADGRRMDYLVNVLGLGAEGGGRVAGAVALRSRRGRACSWASRLMFGPWAVVMSAAVLSTPNGSETESITGDAAVVQTADSLRVEPRHFASNSP